MEIFLYIVIFIIGTVFGSFYTLAVHRIPKRQDIVHTHSYCPNCDHKLGFLDLIPILSYIFLGGKCRYCKQKIRPRYLILEILSGVLFVAVAFALKLSVYNLNYVVILNMIFMALYITYIVLIAGIDKENRKIDKSVLVYGIAISIVYMVYLYIVEKTNIYRYAIYLSLYILALIFDTITLRKYAKSKYISGLIIMLITMTVFSGVYLTANTIIATALAIAISMLIYKLMQKKNRRIEKDIVKEINLGFYLGTMNMIFYIFALICSNYLI